MNNEPIAIIGIGLRYANNINDIDSFWDTLINKRSLITDIPSGRFEDIVDIVDPQRGQGKIVSKQGAWIKDVEYFDANFFNISPREAEKLDPHQRLILETTFEALEDAGQKIEKVWGSKTGVFAGMWVSDFEHVLSNSNSEHDVYSTTGSGRYAASGRVSFFFNLQGPSITVDTACSTSLVSMHLAVQSLQSKESNMAICAAANVLLDPYISICYSRSNLLSDYARCKFGVDDASGYVRCEGAASIVLKRLSDAQNDGDEIYGIIPGTACNNDGQSDKYMLAPSAITQEIMIRAAIKKANLLPSDIQYVEAHGTGTNAGDPIELSSIPNALNDGRSPDDGFMVGSAKTIFGHTEAVAGYTGLIKCILSIRNKIIPGNLYADQPLNKKVDWKNLLLHIPVDSTPWPKPNKPLIAGVNAFGITGTNAHVIVKEAPNKTVLEKNYTHNKLIFILSAASESALKSYAQLHINFIQENIDSAVSFVNYIKNTAIRKADLKYRLAIICTSKEELIAKLNAFIIDTVDENIYTGVSFENKNTVFVFPGQGSQWAGMGMQLYQNDLLFQIIINDFDKAFKKYSSWSLIHELNNVSENALNTIDIIQPALIAIEVAIAKWWMSIGVTPNALVGHSMGEIAAAYIAGAIDLDMAANIICTRSKLMKRTSGKGAMGYIALTIEETSEYIKNKEDKIAIGVSNSPKATVVSGDTMLVEDLLNELESKGVFCRKIKVDVASHSPQMDPLKQELFDSIKNNLPKKENTPFYSTVLAQRVDGEKLDAKYWVSNMRNPVQFSKTVNLLLADKNTIFIECSPHPILTQAITENIEASEFEGIAIGSFFREKDEVDGLLSQLAKGFCSGLSIEWKKFYGTDFQRITLPQYPWQREKHWVSPARDKGGNINNKRLDGTKGHPLLMNYAAIATAPTTHIWQSNISVSQFQYLENHIVEEAITLPAALYLEAFFAAGKEVFENLDFVLKKIKFSNAISLLPEQNIMLQIALEQNIGNNYNISLNYWNTNDNAWIECASAQIANKSNEKIIEDALSLEIAQSICTETISHIQHYEKTASIGLPYSGVFRSVTQILSSENMALGKIKSDDSLSSSLNKYIFHPTILDGCLQVLLSEIYDHPNASTFVPTSIDAIRYYTKEPISEASSLVKIVSESHNKISADIQIFDNNQKILAELKNITFDRLISTGDTSNIDNIYFEVLWNKIEIQTQKLEVSDCVLIGKGDYTKELSKKLNIAFSTTFDTTIKNKNIIYAVPLDSPQEAVYTENDILPLVDIIKNRVNANIETKIFVLTKGAYQIDKDTNILPLSSMFTGFHRVFCNELPEFKPTLIDISLNSYNLELLEKVLSYNGTENEFCIRNDIFVSRLNRITHNEFDQFCPIQKVDYFEAITTPGILENIKIIQKYLPPPKKEEVQIKIESVGINFMNLMSALGIYPGKKDGFATLGIELVGTITQIGAETSLHKIGDKVMGMGYHTMASHTNVNENAVIAIPKNISTEDASTMPVAYLTAYYSIVHLGKLQKGEQILIHSATGGVGLAAIYIAKSLGAEIFATAGSAEKRRYLKESLGIQHVYDSRNNDFYAQIKKDVEGKGLDMVLNSLSGEQMWYSLKLLGSFGRFVEIGKKDVYNNSKLGLEVFQHGLSYFMVDFEKILFEKPQLIQFLLLEINANIVKGEYLPLPVKRFSIDKIIHAFDEMSKANTIGKIVVDINNKNLHLFKNLSDLQIDSLGTYLLTGGYGGLGLVFAQYLAEKGAKKIILTGRSAPSKNALSLINQLVENGVDVKIEQVDVTDAVAVNNLISKIESPLRGIFHLAGVLDDSSIANYDTQKYLNTIKPKVWGATHLHESTKHLDLDYFVLFSSSAVLFGSPGQSAYASANSYMDALAIHRKNLGLAATSINFGTVSDVGLAAAENNRAERLADEGISPLNATDCIKIFEMAIKTQKTVLGAFHFDVDLWQKTYRSAAENPFLSALKNNDQKETPEQKLSLLATLQSITDQQELLTLIEEKIKDKVGLVVKLSPEKIASKTNFKSLGIDSLMSIQLKNQLENQFNTSITVTSFWTYATIKDYAIFLAEKLNLIKKDVPVVDIKEKQKKEPSPPSVENIDVSNISDDDFLNLLANELEDI